MYIWYRYYIDLICENNNMLKTEDLNRTCFYDSELNQRHPLPTNPIKSIPTPKNMDDCLFIIQQAILNKIEQHNKIKDKLETQPDNNILYINLSRLEHSIKLMVKYYTTAISHLTLTRKAKILELHCQQSDTKLFNTAKVQYGKYTFFIQVSKRFLNQKEFIKTPKIGLIPLQQPSVNLAEACHTLNVFEAEAMMVLQDYHDAYIAKRDKIKIRNKKIDEHNSTLKKLKKLIYHGHILVTNAAA